MTLHHDMYLLDLAALQSALTELIPTEHHTALDRRRLLAQVVRLLETNTTVQHLSEDYGGWDATSIQQDFDDLSTMTNADIGWLLSYAVLSAIDITGYHPSTHGFGAVYQDIPRTLIENGWDESDAAQLVFGRSFATFLDQIMGIANRQPYWDHICPASTGAHMGWLSTADARSLSDRLQASLSHWNPTPNTVPKRLRLVAGQLQDALEHDIGLCIIISG